MASYMAINVSRVSRPAKVLDMLINVSRVNRLAKVLDMLIKLSRPGLTTP
jgi:hypothetical protein